MQANNSLFGKYRYSPYPHYKMIFTDKRASKNLIKDFLGRESKTYKEIKKNEQYANYLYNKEDYIENKNIYISNKLEELKEPARNIYKGALERGYTQEEAKKLVKEFTDKEKKNILIDADSIYV